MKLYKEQSSIDYLKSESKTTIQNFVSQLNDLFKKQDDKTDTISILILKIINEQITLFINKSNGFFSITDVVKGIWKNGCRPEINANLFVESVTSELEKFNDVLERKDDLENGILFQRKS